MAVDFIRGDVNGDGNVTIADSHFILSYFSEKGLTPTCLESADANDDGAINFLDGMRVLVCLLEGSQEIPAPFPEPGPDPAGSGGLGCESYGGGTKIEDPAAKITVLDSTASGGEDRRAAIYLRFSNSRSLAGYYVRFLDPAGVIESVEVWSAAGSDDDFNGDLTGTMSGGWFGSHVNRPAPGRIEVTMMSSMHCKRSIPPLEEVDALEMWACIRAGTAAGEYPIEIEAAEFVDAESARVISPALEGGKLVILKDMQSTGCYPLPDPGPRVFFKMQDASAAPGGMASVPFTIRADTESQGFSFSVDFNEEVLQATWIEKLFQRPEDTPYDFEDFEFNNENATPGSGGFDEGYLAGAAIISFSDTAEILPVNQDVPVLKFHLRVAKTAPLGTTELTFLDALGSSSPVENYLIAGGSKITPRTAGSFIFINGRINIIPDGMPFVRGNANFDTAIDISDPVFTLNYLFIGGPQPKCLEAADANDDGDVDISDPVATLNFLFLGASPLPDTPVSKSEPTADSLGCLGGAS